MVHGPAAAPLLARLALAGAGALWGALLAGLLGRHAWLLDLCSHFRVQYSILFALLAIALLLLRRPGAALACGFGAALAALPLLAYHDSRASSVPGPTFRLVTFNFWYRNSDYRRIARHLEETRADAIVLQEIPRPQALELHAHLPSYPYSFVEPARPGAVIFARWPILNSDVVALEPGQLSRRYRSFVDGLDRFGTSRTRLRSWRNKLALHAARTNR